MLENSRRARRVLGGVAGVNLALALAVSAGAVPRPGAGNGLRSVETVASAAVAQDASASVPQSPGNEPTAARQAPVTEAAHTTAAPTTAVPKAPTTTAATPAPTTPVAPTAARTAAPPAATQVAAPTIPPVTTPALPANVARRVPAASEVQGALSSLPGYVHSILTPSPAQVAQLGDKVCTMFDQGQSFAQVKATGLQMVTQVPLTTVLPGGADWVVRTVVTLYCPGHLSKLG